MFGIDGAIAEIVKRREELRRKKELREFRAKARKRNAKRLEEIQLKRQGERLKEILGHETCPLCGWAPLAWKKFDAGDRPGLRLKCRECGWSQSGTWGDLEAT